MITFNTEEHQAFSVVSFELGDPIAPADIQQLDIPSVPLDKGIILSGRGPVWLFGALAHHFHPAQWVASHDPRLGGGVIFASHTPSVRVGTVIAYG